KAGSDERHAVAEGRGLSHVRSITHLIRPEAWGSDHGTTLPATGAQERQSSNEREPSRGCTALASTNRDFHSLDKPHSIAQNQAFSTHSTDCLGCSGFFSVES